MSSRSAPPAPPGPPWRWLTSGVDAPPPGLPAVERLRAKWPAVSIFAVADSSEPDVILQAMRAGANELFVCPTVEESSRLSMEDGLRAAVGRIFERLKAAQAPPTSRTFAFFGAKGGAGTTTLAVNSGVQLARLSGRPTIIIDFKPLLGEVALFLGAQPRFTLLDAVDNLHRLDLEFLRELVATHTSGLDILASSNTVDRPNRQDASALEELVQWLGEYYEFVVIDAGNLTNASAEVAVIVADSIFLVMDALCTAIRNPQRILDRIESMGGGKDRIRILLNRTSERQWQAAVAQTQEAAVKTARATAATAAALAAAKARWKDEGEQAVAAALKQARAEADDRLASRDRQTKGGAARDPDLVIPEARASVEAELANEQARRDPRALNEIPESTTGNDIPTATPDGRQTRNQNPMKWCRTSRSSSGSWSVMSSREPPVEGGGDEVDERDRVVQTVL